MTKRHPLDQYETAPWQVDALLDHLPELTGEVWCPTVGDGALSRRLDEQRPRITIALTNDITEAVTARYHDDATQSLPWWNWQRLHQRPQWVVENPPFNAAFEILKHAYAAATEGVAFLSRISFVEPTQERGEWLAAHPRSLQIVLERYSFTGDGKSDNATCEWLVWSKIPLRNRGGYTAYGYKGAWHDSHSQKRDRRHTHL